MVTEQLHYITNCEEIFIFNNHQMPCLYGFWRFANAYIKYITEESAWKTVIVILKMKNVNIFRVIKWKRRQSLTASFVTVR